jgi:predicted nucleic acid-binding protein
VKLPLREPELGALLHALAEWEGYISSALLGVEVIRACGRYGNRYSADARSFLGDVALVPMDDPILAEAASAEPTLLGSLDALHLATALSVREEIGAFVTYDHSLAEAAEARGMAVLSPC